MAFDPRRDVTVNSGAFRVDVDELCAAHTLISGEEALSIVPARLALDAALGEADAVSGLIPEASARLASAITGALSALNSLETEIDSLRWKLQDTALTYADAENGSSLWELVPGSPMGPKLSARGLGAMVVGPAGLALTGASALVHGAQDASARAGAPWLATLLVPGLSSLVAEKDVCDTVIDGLLFKYHADEASGARLQRDLGRFALDVNSLPAFRGVAQSLAGLGVSQDLNSTSTQSASGVAALAAPLFAYLGFVDFRLGHGLSCGIVVRGADGDTHVRTNGLGSRIPSRFLDARTRSALAAMPEAAPDTHYEGVTTSADAIEHITDMHGGDADNGEIAIEEHVTVGEDGATTRSWTVDIRGTQSFWIGETGPQDMTTNLQGVAGMNSDQLDAIKEAMNAAGIAPGEAVEFAGHSQGGIMAAQLAADPDVRARQARQETARRHSESKRRGQPARQREEQRVRDQGKQAERQHIQGECQCLHDRLNNRVHRREHQGDDRKDDHRLRGRRRLDRNRWNHVDRDPQSGHRGYKTCNEIHCFILAQWDDACTCQFHGIGLHT